MCPSNSGTGAISDMGRDERQPRTIADILVGMHDLLANPAAWSRRAGARRHDGMPCDVCSPAAVSWCLTGAMERILGSIADPALRFVLTTATEMHLLATARHELPELDDLAQFSDDRTTTHDDILRLLDEAIILLGQRPTYPTSALTSARSSRSVKASLA